MQNRSLIILIVLRLLSEASNITFSWLYFQSLVDFLNFFFVFIDAESIADHFASTPVAIWDLEHYFFLTLLSNFGRFLETFFVPSQLMQHRFLIILKSLILNRYLILKYLNRSILMNLHRRILIYYYYYYYNYYYHHDYYLLLLLLLLLILLLSL